MTAFTDANGNAVPVACAVDPERWAGFPDAPAGRPGRGLAIGEWTAERDALRAVCGACPVQADCMALARSLELGGFAAGLTARERELLADADQAPARRLAAAGVEAAPRRKPLPLIVHGTTAGYAAHKRRGIPMCSACRAADRARDRARREQVAS